MQFISAALTHGDISGIAWWAHIGGFVFGIVFLKLFLMLPQTGITGKVRKATVKKKTHRLQVIRPVGTGTDQHMYAIIEITPHEARTGVRKLVNIPQGFHKRLFNVTVPPGVEHGTRLRLKGMGKSDHQTLEKGDLYLKVAIKA